MARKSQEIAREGLEQAIRDDPLCAASWAALSDHAGDYPGIPISPSIRIRARSRLGDEMLDLHDAISQMFNYRGDTPPKHRLRKRGADVVTRLRDKAQSVRAHLRGGLMLGRDVYQTKDDVTYECQARCYVPEFDDRAIIRTRYEHLPNDHYGIAQHIRLAGDDSDNPLWATEHELGAHTEESDPEPIECTPRERMLTVVLVQRVLAQVRRRIAKLQTKARSEDGR